MWKLFTMRMSPELETKLNALRKHDPDLPNQSQMMRLLIERAFKKIERSAASHG